MLNRFYQTLHNQHEEFFNIPQRVRLDTKEDLNLALKSVKDYTSDNDEQLDE